MFILIVVLQFSRTFASGPTIKTAIRPIIPSNIRDLVGFLTKEVIVHDSGNFLIVNKPYGISCVGYKQRNGGIYPNTRINRNDLDFAGYEEPKPINGLTVTDVLPFLASNFSEPHLQFCFGLKRYVSGPVVLPCNKKCYKRLKASTLLCHREKLNEGFHHRALAICNGIPFKLKGHIRGHAVFEKVGEHSEYIFLPNSEFHRRALNAKFAVSGSMDYSVVKSAYGCSLIDITFTKFSRHLPRLMLTSLLCPILGDHMYMKRVLTIDGERVHISPKDQHRTRHVKDDFNSLAAHLHISSAEFSKLPIFWHVYRTVFPFKSATENAEELDLIAACPLPAHMVEMLKCLEMYDAATHHLKEAERIINSKYL